MGDGINTLIMVNDVKKEVYEFGLSVTIGDVLKLFSDCNYIQVAHFSGDTLTMICKWKEGVEI